MAGVECGVVAGATKPCTSSRLSRQGLIVATIWCTLQKLIQLILPQAEHNCIIYGSLLTWLVLLAL